jgi:hypothetical protein
VTLTRAFHLWGHRAVAIGLTTADPTSMEALCEWADVICPLQAYFADGIPPQFASKVTTHFDVGGDVWGKPYHPTLHQLLDGRIRAYLIANKIPHLTSLVREQQPAPITIDSLKVPQRLA